MDALDQVAVDKAMIALDATENKRRSAPMPFWQFPWRQPRLPRSRSVVPLFKYLGGPNAKVLPVPMMNILNGGAHSDAPIDFQEFMIMPKDFPSFSEALKPVWKSFTRSKAS